MKSILLKEFRENTKWALLIFVVLGLLMCWSVDTRSMQADVGLLSGDMRYTTVIGFAAAALALGFAQVFQDQIRGRWSFLVHRPISRGQIFAAKVIVGLSLYFLATLLPLAAVAWWVATPGIVTAPFDWHMILPRLADLMQGVDWYFAGMFVAARPARWIGSRLMPLGFALLASFFSQVFALEFYESVLISIGALIVLLPAAAGAYISGGEYGSQPLFVRLVQGIAISIGIAMASVAALGIGASILDTAFVRQESGTQPQYQITADGRILRVDYQAGGIIAAVDVLGHRLIATEYQKIWKDNLSQTFMSLNGPNLGTIPRAARGYFDGYQISTRYLRPLWTGSRSSNAIVWYYVVNRRTIEGFDPITRRFVGSIGPDGFAPPTQSPAPLPEPLLPMNISADVPASATTAYRLDAVSREIQPVFHTTTDDPITAAGLYYVYTQNSAVSTRYTFVMTASKLHVLADSHEQFAVPLDYHNPPYYQVAIGQATDESFVLEYFPSNFEHSYVVVKADPAGRILSKQVLPLLGSQEVIEPRWAAALEIMPILAAPPAFLAAVYFAGDDAVNERILGIMAPIIAVLGALVIIRFLPRRTSGGASRFVWIIIAACCGLCAIPLLISLKDAVPMEVCAGCGKKRLVNRKLCENCGKPFENPAPEGIEIFEPAVA
jgi:hypothetical protein